MVKNNKRAPNEGDTTIITALDKYVGDRIRKRRLTLQMTQEELGVALGVTYQQVQKYERGTGRLWLARLQEIAQVLDAPLAYFHEGAPGVKHAKDHALFELLSTVEATELVNAINGIESHLVRRLMVDLVARISEADQLTRALTKVHRHDQVRNPAS